jgi:hypothetical protein
MKEKAQDRDPDLLFVLWQAFGSSAARVRAFRSERRMKSLHTLDYVLSLSPLLVYLPLALVLGVAWLKPSRWKGKI